MGMAEICCGVVSEKEASTECEPVTRAARRRRMEIRRFKFVANVAAPLDLGRCKRQKIEAPTSLLESEDFQNSLLGSAAEEQKQADGGVEAEAEQSLNRSSGTPPVKLPATEDICPKFGSTSVCGRRREMEDAVSIHPLFFHRRGQISARFHFFGVYDGHGCSHVAMSCKERLHTLVAEELGNEDTVTEWKAAMERSFSRMGSEVAGGGGDGLLPANCRCEMQTPQCDAVGSTAVIAVVGPDTVVVANCGDSRAVLCRNGNSMPLSSDHKPDRPDELLRIQAAGGRVIYWDGPRVLGVLAMSRAIGDYYLKPYVTSEPEVTVTDRTSDDEFLILASDGLWDVISNDTACNIVRMCLRSHHASPLMGNDVDAGSGNGSDRACTDASMLLTKLALARHSTDNVSVVVVDLRRDSRNL